MFMIFIQKMRDHKRKDNFDFGLYLFFLSGFKSLFTIAEIRNIHVIWTYSANIFFDNHRFILIATDCYESLLVAV